MTTMNKHLNRTIEQLDKKILELKLKNEYRRGYLAALREHFNKEVEKVGEEDNE